MSVIEPVVLTKGAPGETCPIAKTLDVIGTKWTFFNYSRSTNRRNNAVQ